MMPLNFDGEKTPYELGMPYEFNLDYNALRQRSWEAFIKSDIIQNGIKKYLLWLVGSGLKLQSIPVTAVIGENTNFVKQVEPRFRLSADLNLSDYSGMQNLHALAKEALKNAMLSGDVLVIQRTDGQSVNVQLIDGCFIASPYDQALNEAAKKRGNRIIEGVELNKKNKHVAFYVRNDKGGYDRISATNKAGRKQAWLMYAAKHKIHDVRGMSLLTAVIESVAKLDRYKEATIGTAEENAKIVYTIEHNQHSDGENPTLKMLQQSQGRGQGTAPETTAYSDGENVANKIAQTTEKQTFNMPIGSKLNQHSGATDPEFENFYKPNSSIIYSTMGIPPEVANDLFGGSYSGSRAALKSWEYKVAVDRVEIITNQFYKPIYDFWMDVQVLNGSIDIPGYLSALISKDEFKLGAYRNCRFIGAGVPHIDPVKEVKAERLKLGTIYDSVPLTTGEQATESLNTGDFEDIISKSEREQELFSNMISEEEQEQEEIN
jgi:capsid protein